MGGAADACVRVGSGDRRIVVVNWENWELESER